MTSTLTGTLNGKNITGTVGTDPVVVGAVAGVSDQVKVLATNVGILGTKLDVINGKIDTLTTMVAALSGDTPLPPASDWPPSSQPADGSTLTLSAGNKLASYHFDNAITLKGAGMRKTILDGQGGAANGHRLAWGKGIVHTLKSITIQDTGFIHGGQLGDGKGDSDGEAGFYGEVGPASLTLLRCAFDGNENGVFVPPFQADGKFVDLFIFSSVFGRNVSNGLSDGRSHDIYVGPKTLTLKNSLWAGYSLGHSIKVRGPDLLIEDCQVRRANGRWIDTPGGCFVVSSRNTYITNPEVSSANAFGFYDENDDAANPGKFGGFQSIDDSFYFCRSREVIWINNFSTLVTFVRPKVFWVGVVGSPPPVVEIQGPGVITGPNPFVFTAANRVDSAPAFPADPVA